MTAKKPRPKLFYMLERASHSVWRQLERTARDALGVSAAQVSALFFLGTSDGCLQKDLADFLGVQAAAVSGLVDRMEQGGLVVRRLDANDGRAQRIHITAAGRRVAARAVPLVQDMQAALVAGFSADEIDTIIRFLTAAMESDLAGRRSS